MIKARRLGHATFETPDLDRLVDYYTQVNGLAVAAREPGRVYLTSRIGQLVMQLERGEVPRCIGLSFEVAPGEDLGVMAQQFTKEGMASEVRSDIAPGVSRSLTFLDPKGTAIDLFQSWNFLDHDSSMQGVGPLKLGHLAFQVKDPQSMSSFYCQMLGFRVSDWIEDFFAFLRCGPDHHTINFVRGKENRFHHIAFELKDWAHIQSACELLGKRNIPIIWGPGRHGVGHNLFVYHRNPDDQIIEFYAEIDQMKDEELGYFDPRPWHQDRPQRPKVWPREGASLMWGPPPTPDYLRSREV